ncbi:MAG TPA: hypothetical protein VN716_09310 [Vicinamibacterales bacterium]|nr:hypothetical protein [Vicinamibacterales bacterium]
MVRRVLAACVLTLTADLAQAQVLSIGETLGRGKSGLLLTDNAIVPGEGIPNLNIFYGEFARGLGDRFDLYLSFGETTTDGETQVWTGGGGNLRLARAGKVTFSLFTVASVALTRRDEACQVLWNPALIASVPVGKQLTVYSGVNGLIPIGDRERGIFTPPSTKVNVPIGATYAIGPWGLWGEVDVGNLQAVGVGITRIW